MKQSKKPSKRKPVKRQSEKEYVIKKTAHMKIARYVLWFMLGFIFLRGVISCLHADKTAEINGLIQDFKSEFYSTKDTSNEILSFAQNFTYEYLTYDVDGKESFISRISPYASKKIVGLENIYDFKSKCEVLYAAAYRTEEISEYQVDVFVRATVKYTIYDVQEDNSTEIVNRLKEVIVCVPVNVGSRGYAVEDLPVFVNDMMLDEANCTNEQPGSEIDSEPYEETVKNFLKAYCGADQSVLDYFISTDADVSKFYCLNGSYELVKVNSINTFQCEDNSVICAVTYQIKDVINSAVLTQKVSLKIISSGKRLYVKDIMTKSF